LTLMTKMRNATSMPAVRTRTPHAPRDHTQPSLSIPAAGSRVRIGTPPFLTSGSPKKIDKVLGRHLWLFFNNKVSAIFNTDDRKSIPRFANCAGSTVSEVPNGVLPSNPAFFGRPVSQNLTGEFGSPRDMVRVKQPLSVRTRRSVLRYLIVAIELCPEYTVGQALSPIRKRVVRSGSTFQGEKLS
jgi:hypothetical protein